MTIIFRFRMIMPVISFCIFFSFIYFTITNRTIFTCSQCQSHCLSASYIFKGEGRTSLGQSRKLALIVVNISVLGAVIIIPYFLDIIKVIVYISYRKIILDGYFT